MTFNYEKAGSLPEAIALYAMHAGKYPVLAGGTDIVVQWRSGLLDLKGVVDISGVDELKEIREVDDFIEIGALCTHARIYSSDIIKKFVPVLGKASRTIGALQIQNRGTIGGNIMNASPAGDTLPVIVACGAELKLQSLTGERWIPAEKFFIGYRKTAPGTNELLTRIKFPKAAKNEVARFYKIGARRAQAISKVVMCCLAIIDHGGIGKIAIALGSVAPTVVRAYGTEILLKGRVINAALIDAARHSLEDEVHPIDDVRSTAMYRKHVCGTLIAKFLRESSRGHMG